MAHKLLHTMSLRRNLVDVAPLWVSGLALILVMITLTFFQADPRDARMPIYLLLGTVFPVSVLIVALRRESDRPWTVTELSLAVLCVPLSLPLLFRYSSVYALALAASQWLITLLLVNASQNAGDQRSLTSAVEGTLRLISTSPANAVGGLVALYVAVVCWTITIQLLRGGEWIFGEFVFLDSSRFREWTLVNRSFLPVLVLSSLLLFTSLYFVRRSSERSRSSSSGVINLVRNWFAFTIIAVLSFRSDQWAGQDFLADAYNHWVYFVGPAEDVRHGGWLLWDVPSWYGFGSILLLAVLPTESCWQSMYLINSFALLFCAVLLYLILKALRPSWIGWLFSLATTIACVFLLPGNMVEISGPQLWPSAAAFRFLWVYVLLAILWWGYRRYLRGESAWRVLHLGCLAWVAGVVWSFESAIYVTTVWLPVFSLLLWHYAGESDGKTSQRVVAVLVGLTIPFFLLIVVLGGVLSFYWFMAGHLPEMSAYYEIAWGFRAYRDEFYAGSVGLWVLMLIFCAASTTFVTLLRGQCIWTIAMAVAAWATFWSTSSYMVVKADQTMLLSGSPLIVTSLGLLVYLLNQQVTERRIASLPHATFASVLTVLLTLAYGNFPKVLETLADVRVGYAGLASQLPTLYAGWIPIFRGAGVQADDRVIFLHAVIPPTLVSPTFLPWLPTQSWARLVQDGTALNNYSPTVVPIDRMREYASRAMARAPSGGYIFAPWEAKTSPSYWWLFDQLRRSYIETLVYQTPEFVLLRYESRDYSSSALKNGATQNSRHLLDTTKN